MTMPVMEPDLDAATLKAWARAIDDGPFSSLCWGGRIAFDNPEAVTLLGALAAWTDRVRLVTTVLVPQLHDAVLLAKSLATGDMLSRRTADRRRGCRRAKRGLPRRRRRPRDPDDARHGRAGGSDEAGVGRRERDRVVVPVGPAPLQQAGPPLLVGTMGPKTVRSAAAWADGLAGTTLDLDLAKQNELFDVARTASAQAGKPKPLLWPHRFGLRWATPMMRAHRSTAICAAT